ncbi:MAG: preprotein translocase subunit SecA, partial [Ruminococcus sp.]|nr:preprotein translocase subunit SecA [Ruminococcus sp.]
IVDEFTGRIMQGRRFNDGLHQAIEAKENVEVKRESKTIATITYQNYFRLYGKLSGMTGTALTEEDEFREIYKLDVIEVPTNKPVIRIDHPDVVYKTEKGKFNAVIEQIIECHKKGQPVLVGTVSIEKSEYLSRLLKAKGIKHEVLNAKHHDKEAFIVAQAGKFGSVTIATNMAGRGTDILLGGNAEYRALQDVQKQGYSEECAVEASGFSNTEDPDVLEARKLYRKAYEKYSEEIKELADKVREAGGLYIIGTERHESRRIDNQLRGRSGRQGDPGESTFFLSLEDDLMRIFGGERITAMMDRLNVDENTPIQSNMLSGVIESSQKKIEGRNFNIRKNVLNYDDVMNTQREIIYGQRQRVLDSGVEGGSDPDGAVLHEDIITMIKDFVVDSVNMYLVGDITDDWNLQGLKERLMGLITVEDDFEYTPQELDDLTREKIIDQLTERALKIYEKREEDLTTPILREIERVVLLKVVDTKWMDHIDDMEELKRGIGLRSYGQRNPVVEYRVEGMDMFDEMVASIREDTVRMLFTVQVRQNNAPKREQVLKPAEHHNITVRKNKKRKS